MNLAITIQIILLVLVIGQMFYYKHKQKQDKIKLESEKQKIREDAIKISKSVMTGKIAEEMIPMFKDFPYNIQDCKFLSQPIDYIVYDGMSHFRNTGEGEITIVISDVKTNNAQTTKVQKAIKKAIEEKRIRWETWNVKNGEISIK